MSNVETMDWTFSTDEPATTSPTNPLRFRKQALYVGATPVLEDGSTRTITDEDIDIILANGKKRLSMGIRHPLVVAENHSATAPEYNKGLIDTFEEGYDSKGQRSLYLGGEVDSQETINTLRTNDISILAPAVDNVAGVRWERAIKNALVTGYPRVKGLEPFTLALSEPSSPSDKCEKCGKEKECSSCKEEPEEMELSEVVGYDPTDHGAIDGKAAAIAKTDGRAYLVSENDRVLVLPKSELNGRTPYREMV